MATSLIDPKLHRKYLGIFGPDGFLNRNNVERREETEILGICLIAGIDPIFLGDPGVGKTYIIELMTDHCITGAKLFTHLFAKDQSANEVLGPPDVMAMKAGKQLRLVEGYLPTAHVGYGDEIFKSSPPMLNPLLDILANRVLKMGGSVLQCGQLIMFVMSSNELPDREDLQAFRDRIALTKFVDPVRTPEGRRAVTDLQLDQQAHGINKSGLDPLTLDDIIAIRDSAKRITVPDTVREMMTVAEAKWAEKGHSPSKRRVGQMWKAVKAHAFHNNRDTVIADDLIICQHMAWNHPDHAASAREVVLEFASQFTRHANRIREAMEPVVHDLEDMRVKYDAAAEEDKDDILNPAYKLMRQLRGMKKEAVDLVKQGNDTGQDTSMLQQVLGEITKSYDWAEMALTGADE